MSPQPLTRSAPLIDRYAAGGNILAYALTGLTADHEAARPGPGLWSLGELAAHLLDSDLVYADRIKRLLAEDDPVLHGFDENAWVARLPAGPVVESVGLLAANRKWMARLLRGAEEADFARAGRHTERGRMTLTEALSYATNHVDHHLRFVYAKRANLGIALPPRYGSEALGI